ncbi:MAG: polysaccharide deacetylase family protein, partial [Proteobacteria bacterium]|nr:polysaccharide deacetylase family protein [Bacteroidota bacterium]MBU1571449.1 polysaccharide deacetylase family protein [Pseudomonadota bacterium]
MYIEKLSCKFKLIFSLVSVLFFMQLLILNPVLTQAADSLLDGEPDKPTMVNIQVDLEKEGDQDSVCSILSEIESRGWNVTVYVTGEFAANHPTVVKDIHDKGHQIAVHGWQSGENLTLLSYEEQLDLLTRAFTAVRTAVGNMRPAYIADFKPQEPFKQNEDTYKALQALEVRSN